MKSVRLIAGPGRGQIKQVDDDQTVLTYLDSKPIAASVTRRSIEPAAITVHPMQYTRRMVRTGEGRIDYFAPEGVTDLEALQHVLGP